MERVALVCRAVLETPMPLGLLHTDITINIAMFQVCGYRISVNIHSFLTAPIGAREADYPYSREPCTRKKKNTISIN